MQSSIPNFFCQFRQSYLEKLKTRNWNLHSIFNKNFNMFYNLNPVFSSVGVRRTAFSKTSPTLNRWRQSFEVMIDVSSSFWVNNVHVIFGTGDPSMEIVLPQTSISLSPGLEEAQNGNLEKCLALHYASIQKKWSAEMNPQRSISWQSNRLLVDSFRGET